MNIKVVKEIDVDVKEIHTHIKIGDSFECKIVDSNGQTQFTYEGYVPSFFPGLHFGDYMYLNIDIETGQILNWKKPTEEQLANFIKYA
jgi:hypothetical protein